MEIILDENQLMMESKPENLEEVIQEVMTRYAGGERILWSVALNGHNCGRMNQHETQAVGADAIEKLEISTKDNREIAVDFLRHGVDVLVIMQESAKRISGLLRTVGEKEANERYMEFIQAYMDFFEMLMHSKETLNLDFNQINFTGSSLEDNLDVLKALFDRMITVQENRDWVALADLLEYELEPILKKWQVILPMLEKEVSAVH